MSLVKQSLGETLVEKGLLTQKQLHEVLDKASSSDDSFCRIIIDNGLIDEIKLATFLGHYLNLPVVNLVTRKIDKSVIAKLPSEMARKYSVFPLFFVMDVMTVAMADPLDYRAIEEIEFHTHCRVEPVVATLTDVTTSLDKYYGTFTSIKKIVEKMGDGEGSESFDDLDAIGKVFDVEETTGPVNKLLHLIMSYAVRERASDIHFERKPSGLMIRFRIDGVLHQVMNFPLNLSASLISSIKILARMDIAEKRLPLDGGFQARIDGRIIDLRISSFPMLYGEKVVIRLLDQEGVLFNLDELGMTEALLCNIHSLISKPHGIFLVTGPTGSGKTSTLYSILNTIKSVEKNIVTIEDPIEYHLDLINQSQVNIKAGLDFVSALRSFLRQDPDIILVGEIRDTDTARMAFQAALTGHMVFATLHTNDAASSVVRLVNMGIEPYLITSTVVGVLAQRLVRHVCKSCQTDYIPEPEAVKWAENQNCLVTEDLEKPLERMMYSKGSGCKNCRDTGYKGRLGIFELLTFSDHLKTIINQGDVSEIDIKRELVKQGMVFLKDDGLFKVRQQRTTLEEVMRVVR